MTFRTARRGRTYVIAGGAALAAVALAAAIVLLDRQDAASTPPATVQVKRGDVTMSVVASGKVQPVSTRSLAFTTSGTLTSVAVKAGDSVAAGQTLATIDPADAQSALDDAEQAVDEAEATLDAAETAAAQPTSSARPGGGGSSKDAVYEAEVALNKAKLARDKAARVRAGTTITAPAAGRILSVAGKAGDAVKTDTFITLGVVEKMLVEASFAEADAVTLAVGQKAKAALASHDGQTFDVTISQVAAAGTVSNRLVRYTVLLAFDSPPADLLIGQNATATVVLKRSAGVLYLPASAVTTAGDVKLVDGRTQRVQVGLRGDGNVEVSSGLDEGATVLLNAR